MSHMTEQFLSEVIRPVPGTVELGRMAAGEPGLPRQFRRGGETIGVAEVLKTWRETGACSHGSGERYLRKHWYEVRTDTGSTLKLYFERKPRRGSVDRRWVLYSVRD